MNRLKLFVKHKLLYPRTLKWVLGCYIIIELYFFPYIIIIDYIDMYSEEKKDEIIKLMKQEIKKDGSKVQVEGFTKLNLLEITRKHVYSS